MANGRRKMNERLGRAARNSQRPTTAGQRIFGDVDVMGAQTTAREQERMNERLGQSARGLLGAQMTEAERRRLGRGR
jgi:hypothetical protein